ncbi:AAA family ATPase [Candidatus Electronema sp. PJ]|uniref:SF1B family DNA helicase RecD2 n=1 Tax=Candidatus Electronema sp. PJ TaxID=3401572 RepID=UPI003AA8E566
MLLPLPSSQLPPETLSGVVERITYHNPENGWAVLRVNPFDSRGGTATVIVHQLRVFAGATMQFSGAWIVHPRFGRQFKADKATELKPASAGALEKYLGSGLIKGIGPKTAHKIVQHFGKDTLEVFEEQIKRLTEVPGIAEKKLASISAAWTEHRAIRDVMIFLQTHGISTLFAVRIYKQYGDNSIAVVSANPYRLAEDLYGIGFFTADKVALSIGFGKDAPLRITAAIRHVLSASREQGHCWLTQAQIDTQVSQLLELNLSDRIALFLHEMEQQDSLRVRLLIIGKSQEREQCYYAKSLYYDERYVAERLRKMVRPLPHNVERIVDWLHRYGEKSGIQLSEEQRAAVQAIACCQLAILTGGPGCGKTTTTKVLVALLRAMGRSVLLAAPTGRAAQRMGEVIGAEAKTIHRLLEYQGTGFKRNQETPLRTDVLIVDECSMLDISLTASLLKAVSEETALVFIGDADQLPSVGAGNVLRDLIASGYIPVCTLNTIFRQASQSSIITFAHQINRGETPKISSPFKQPALWKTSDCLFIDSDEATQAQLGFIAKVKQHFQTIEEREQAGGSDPFGTETAAFTPEPYQRFEVPEQFRHADVYAVATAESPAEELASVVKKVHPWSSLYYGMTAVDTVRRLYTEWIPKYCGQGCEIQVLSPMNRGSLGTGSLNKMLQEAVNPTQEGRAEIKIGERLFRVGDRVIHLRNNYDLGVFNGDIGKITAVDNGEMTMRICFFPDQREVEYQREQITELDLAYAITIHKSQGSEFEAIIIPVMTQHYRMLFRNLIYTGLTRARKLAVFVGTRKALTMAVANKDTGLRQTALRELVGGER